MSRALLFRLLALLGRRCKSGSFLLPSFALNFTSDPLYPAFFSLTWRERLAMLRCSVSIRGAVRILYEIHSWVLSRSDSDPEESIHLSAVAGQSFLRELLRFYSVLSSLPLSPPSPSIHNAFPVLPGIVKHFNSEFARHPCIKPPTAPELLR